MRAFVRFKNTIWDRFVHFLTDESPNFQSPLTSFERLRYELRPGDVILVEGRSRVGDIIKTVTQSMWTHSFLYIGRLHDIDDPLVRDQIVKNRNCNPDEQLIIESMLGEGTVVNNIEIYDGEHLRICRPRGITRTDSQKVINYAVGHLGIDYDIRQLLDLARFMIPWLMVPKRWRSSLFEHKAGIPTKTVCSTMLAEAFAKVRFPIIPVLHQTSSGQIKLKKSNSKLITPRDFDHSPYFDVIKYPVLEFDELGMYRKLPWDKLGVQQHSYEVLIIPQDKESEQADQEPDQVKTGTSNSSSNADTNKARASVLSPIRPSSQASNRANHDNLQTETTSDEQNSTNKNSMLDSLLDKSRFSM